MKKNNTISLCLIGFFVGILLTLPFAKAEGGIMELTSSAFDEGGMIPGKYTCDGADVSPPLKWGSLPDGTKSLALICDDPDAPMGTWVHWVYYDIPAKITDLPENITPDEHPAPGGVQGINDFLVFSATAFTALTSGFFHHLLGWERLNLYTNVTRELDPLEAPAGVAFEVGR